MSVRKDLFMTLISFLSHEVSIEAIVCEEHARQFLRLQRGNRQQKREASSERVARESDSGKNHPVRSASPDSTSQSGWIRGIPRASRYPEGSRPTGRSPRV